MMQHEYSGKSNTNTLWMDLHKQSCEHVPLDVHNNYEFYKINFQMTAQQKNNTKKAGCLRHVIQDKCSEAHLVKTPIYSSCVQGSWAHLRRSPSTSVFHSRSRHQKCQKIVEIIQYTILVEYNDMWDTWHAICSLVSCLMDWTPAA